MATIDSYKATLSTVSNKRVNTVVTRSDDFFFMMGPAHIKSTNVF